MICTVVPFGSFTGCEAVFLGTFTVTSFEGFFEERDDPDEPEDPEEDPDDPEDPDDEFDDLLDWAEASGSPTTPSATEVAAAREMTCVRAVKRIATRFTNTWGFPTAKH